MKISVVNKVIENPKEAREWIKKFMKAMGQEYKGGFVDTEKRRIEFDTMNDEDALFVANQLQGWTAEAAKQRGIKRYCSCSDDVTFGGYQNQELVTIPDTVQLRKNTPERELRKEVSIDSCLVEEIKNLWSLGIVTTGCCCGHNQAQGYIGVDETFIEKMRDLGYENFKNELHPERQDSFKPKSIEERSKP